VQVFQCSQVKRSHKRGSGSHLYAHDPRSGDRGSRLFPNWSRPHNRGTQIMPPVLTNIIDLSYFIKHQNNLKNMYLCMGFMLQMRRLLRGICIFDKMLCF
jgi:hypothetical protein